MDAAEWDRRYAASELVWGAEPNRWLVQEVGALRPGTALDLGAGEGRNAVWLAEQGWQVTAVDFSAEGLEKLRQRAAAGGHQIAGMCADVLTYEPATTFDLVVLLYLQLRAGQRAAVHRRAAAALSPGATLLVVGHDTTNLEQGHGGPPDPAVLFSPADVCEDVAAVGLVVEKAERVHRPVATPEGERVAIDALVRLRRPAS